MSFGSDEVNFLVYRYLQESGEFVISSVFTYKMLKAVVLLLQLQTTSILSLLNIFVPFGRYPQLFTKLAYSVF